MSDTPEKIILYSSDEAAKRATVTGWVDRLGWFHGDDARSEHLARWSGATHLSCKKCGTVHNKNTTTCDPCHALHMAEVWNELKKRPWDGTTPVTLHDGDEFFFDAESFANWCADNDVRPEDVRLVHCKPQLLSTIDEDHFADDLPEDGELPPAIAEALAALNTAIQAHTEPVSWWADNVAVDPESLKGLEVPQ